MTTKASTSVKWFHSEMADAPVLRGESGALIQLLDACLINGFSTRSPDNIVVSAGVATVNISAGNPFDQHAVIKISGATPAALNDEWRIATAEATSFTFVCPGIADGTATGTISVMRAGAGWEKAYSDTNKAAYRAINAAMTRRFLRVDDRDAMLVMVRGYEEMTGIDAMTGPFPTEAQVSLANYMWRKSNVASSASRKWVMAVDDGFVYFSSAWSSSYPSSYDVVAFGDILALNPTDEYHCMIAAHPSQPVFPQQSLQFFNLTNAAGKYLARSYTQAAGAIPCAMAGSGIESSFGRVSPGAVAYPSVVDGSLHLHAPVAIMNGSSMLEVIRGTLPGAHQPLQYKPLQSKDIVEPSADQPALLIMACAGSGASDQHRIALTISEAWR